MRLNDPVWQSVPQIGKILSALKGKARFVGGCVRDTLAGREPADIDMATPLKPAAVMGILKKRGFTVLPTGFLYGTVTVLTGDDRFPTIEMTTLRRDIENDGRRPKVVYTKDWEEDAARRDFTFNALYADFDGTVYDYCGGVRDLNDGRVRFIGDPAQRIGEDCLRILRYFRFLARFDAEPDAATMDACRSGGGGLARLSLDRTRRELFKLVESDNAARGLSAMNDAGLLETYFPAQGLPVLSRFLRLFPAARLPFRLAALYGVTPEGTEAATQRWQLSKTQRKPMMLAASFDRSKPPESYTDNNVFRFAVLFRETGTDEVSSLLASVDDNDGWLSLGEKCRGVEIPPFRFSGGDLTELVKKNQIKAALAQVHEHWLAENGRIGRAGLLDFARERFTPRR